MSNRLTRGRTLDHAAALYDFVQPIVTLGREYAYNRRIVEELAVQPGDRVLDLGCGTGTLTRQIGERLDAAAGGLAIGIDAAPKMIAVANNKRSSPTTQFETVAAERLPYPPESFDKACSSFFFHHVDYELKVGALTEARRVLRPGGIILLLDIDIPTNWYGRLCMYLSEWALRQPEIGENRTGELRKAFSEAGFTTWIALDHWQGYVTLFRLGSRA